MFNFIGSYLTVIYLTVIVGLTFNLQGKKLKSKWKVLKRTHLFFLKKTMNIGLK